MVAEKWMDASTSITSSFLAVGRACRELLDRAWDVRCRGHPRRIHRLRAVFIRRSLRDSITQSRRAGQCDRVRESIISVDAAGDGGGHAVSGVVPEPMGMGMRRMLTHTTRLARSRAALSSGSRIATSTATMPITTSSSMSPIFLLRSRAAPLEKIRNSFPRFPEEICESRCAALRDFRSSAQQSPYRWMKLFFHPLARLCGQGPLFDIRIPALLAR